MITNTFVVSETATPLPAPSLREPSFTYELTIDMGVTGGIEPRWGGVRKLEIDVDDATFCAGPVTVDCSPTAWTGRQRHSRQR